MSTKIAPDTVGLWRVKTLAGGGDISSVSGHVYEKNEDVARAVHQDPTLWHPTLEPVAFQTVDAYQKVVDARVSAEQAKKELEAAEQSAKDLGALSAGAVIGWEP